MELIGLAQQYWEILLKACADGDRDSAGQATELLGSLLGEDDVPGLLRQIEGGTKLVKEATKRVLAHVHPTNVPALIEALRSSDEDVRDAGGEALEWLTFQEDAIPGLARALRDPDPEIRLTAAYAFRSLCRDWAECPEHADSGVAAEIVVALLPVLENHNENSRVRWAIMWGLEYLGPAARNATEALLEIIALDYYTDLDDLPLVVGEWSPRALRDDAEHVLKRIGITALPAIMEAFRDSRPAIRWAAGEALKEIDERRDKPFVEMLGDRYSLEGLELMGDEARQAKASLEVFYAAGMLCKERKTSQFKMAAVARRCNLKEGETRNQLRKASEFLRRYFRDHDERHLEIPADDDPNPDPGEKLVQRGQGSASVFQVLGYEAVELIGRFFEREEAREKARQSKRQSG